jgi:O-Antigen ligase
MGLSPTSADRFSGEPHGGLGRVVDALLTFTVVLLAVYPWLAEQVPGASFGRVLLGAALSIAVLIEATRRWSRSLLPMTVALAIVVCLQALALERAPDLTYGAREFLNWTLYLPVALAAWPWRRARLVAGAFLVAGVVLLAGAVAQRGGVLEGTWGVPSAGDDGITRFTSFLQNPNDFGLVMGLCVVLGSAMALRSVGRQRVCLALVVVLFALGVVASASRGSLLATLVGSAVLATVAWRSRAHRSSARSRLLGPAALVVLAFVVLVGASVRDFDHSVPRSVSGDESASQRLDRWRALLDGPLDPIVGSGYGGFAETLDRESQNLIINGSAEGLSAWGPLTGAEPLELESELVAEGSRSIRARGTAIGEPARVAIGTGRTPAIPERRYRFEVAVRPVETGSSREVRLSVKWHPRESADFVEEVGAVHMPALGRWRRVVAEVQAPAGTEFATGVVTIVPTPDRRASALLDDASFTRIDPIFLADAPAPLWALRRELTVDNSVLRLFLEEGVLGILAMLGVVGAALLTRTTVVPPDPLVHVLPFIALAMISVRALTVDLFSQPLWSFLIWLCLGLVAAYPELTRRA